MAEQLTKGELVRLFNPGHASHGHRGTVVHVQRGKDGAEDLVTVDLPSYCSCVVRASLLERVEA